MNHVLRAAGDSVSLGWLMGLTTLLFIAAFVAWTWWAYAPSRKAKMEEAGRIPFEGED